MIPAIAGWSSRDHSEWPPSRVDSGASGVEVSCNRGPPPVHSWQALKASTAWQHGCATVLACCAGKHRIDRLLPGNAEQDRVKSGPHPAVCPGGLSGQPIWAAHTGEVI